MFTLLLLTCFPSGIEPAPEHETHTVELPRSPLFLFATRRDIPDLDRLFTRKRQPESMSVNLVLPAQERQSLVSAAIVVQKGSMTVATESGYLKFLPERKVVAKAEGKAEREFEFEHAPGFWFAFRQEQTNASKPQLGAHLSLGILPEMPVTDTAATAPRKMQREGFLPQELLIRADDHRPIVPLKLTFSPDFEGSVSDWHVRPIGK